MNDKDESTRFIKKARELGCDEDEAAFDRALRHLTKPPTSDDPKKRVTKKLGTRKRR